MKKTLITAAVSLALGMTSASSFAGWQEWLNSGKEKFDQWTQDVQPSKEVKTTINACMASEKKHWLNAVVPNFQRQYPNITVNLVIKGSGDLMTAMQNGNSLNCDLVSPASAVSALRWEGYQPEKAQALVYSPLVIASLQDKAEAIKKHLQTDRLGISELIKVGDTRWDAIDEKYKDWGKIRVGVTDWNSSNSGLVALVTAGYVVADVFEPLTGGDLEEANVQAGLESFVKNTNHKEKSTSKLTSNFKRSSLRYTAIVTYENLLPELHQKYGADLYVDYPRRVLMNDHPVQITAKSEANQQAARAFVGYLLSKPVQQRASSEFGFRPAHPDVAMSGPILNLVKQDLPIVDAPENWDIVQAMIDVAKGEW